VIEDLVRRARAPVGHPGKLVQVVDVEVRHAPARDLSVALQALEGLDRLGQRDVAAPVEQVEIQARDAQALEAALARRDGRTLPGVVRVDLRDDEDLVAPALDRLSNDFARSVVSAILEAF